jgi:hypothetical protein
MTKLLNGLFLVVLLIFVVLTYPIILLGEKVIKRTKSVKSNPGNGPDYDVEIYDATTKNKNNT